MTGKPKSAYLPEGLIDRINDSPYNFSAETREFWQAKLSTTSDATLQTLENNLKDVIDEIETLEIQLSEKREARAELEERIDGLKRRNEERRKAVHDAVCSVKGFIPDCRSPDDVVSAADGTGLTPAELAQLVEDIDLGHYEKPGTPDSISDDEAQAVDDWLKHHV